MQELRRFLSWTFAIASLLGLWISFWFVPHIIHRHNAFSPLRSFLAAAVFPIMATIYGVAWWTFWKGKHRREAGELSQALRIFCLHSG